MAVRGFDGVDDKIDFSLGNVVGAENGALTIAVIWKPTVVAAQGLLFVNEFGNPIYGINPWQDGNLYFSVNGSTTMGSYTATDGWRCDVVSKPDGNSVTPHYSNYRFDVGTWSHNDGAAISEWGGGTNPNLIQIGKWGNGAEVLNGNMLMAGIWKRVLSDVERQTLTGGISAWAASNPDWYIAMDQSSTATAVTDLSGGGGNQSAIIGTTVITNDDPPGFSSEFEGWGVQMF